MNSIKKTLGISLLFVGLAIIIYGLYSSYNIFLAKAAAPEIFKAEAVSSQKSDGPNIEAQLQQMIQEQLKGIMPVDSIPQLLNLISWSIFAGILILGGGQISSLGTKLIK